MIYFEGGFSGAGVANSWTITSSASYTSSQDTGYSGSAQKINITSAGSWGLFFYQRPTFTLNETYLWSFWYKTSPGAGTIYAQIVDGPCSNSCAYLVHDESLPDTNGSWVFKTITFKYTDVLKIADELRFYSGGSTGSYWFDQVALRGAPDPASMDDCAFSPAENRTITMFNDGICSYETEADATVPASVSLPAGHYKVSLMSYDGYINRVNVSQPNEKYFVKFYNGTNLVAQSNSLNDLADYVAYTNTIQPNPVNSDLNLTQNIDSIKAWHTAYYDNTSCNSNQPICAAFDRLDPPAGDGGGGGDGSVANYVLERAVSGLANWAGVSGSPLPASTVSYSDTLVAPSTSYDYRLKACDAGSSCSGYATLSDIVSACCPAFDLNSSNSIWATIPAGGTGSVDSTRTTISVPSAACGFINPVDLSLQSISGPPGSDTSGFVFHFGKSGGTSITTLVSLGGVYDTTAFWVTIPDNALRGTYTINIKGDGSIVANNVIVSLNVDIITPFWIEF